MPNKIHRYGATDRSQRIQIPGEGFSVTSPTVKQNQRRLIIAYLYHPREVAPTLYKIRLCAQQINVNAIRHSDPLLMRNDNFAEVLPCAEFTVGCLGLFEGHLVVDHRLNAVRSHKAIHCAEILSMTHGDAIE